MELFVGVVFFALFIFGAIVGSFLNVVIYRLHTGKSVVGRSHCLSCGHTLEWFELFPILSYIALRARCRSCASFIPPRYLIVELLTGLAFIFAHVVTQGAYLPLLLHLILFSLLIVIVVYDIRHTIIPNELVVALIALAVVFLGLLFWETGDSARVFTHVLSGVGASGFFFALWLLSKGRWIGLGDAKLALPLGSIVGPSAVFSMVVFSFWIGAVVSLSMLIGQRMWINRRAYISMMQSVLTTSNESEGKRSRLSFPSTDVAKYRRYFTMKSEVPFAPFLVLGFLLAYAFHIDIFTFSFLFIW